MRRVAAVFGLVLAGAALWGLGIYGPDLRWYLRVRWRAMAAARGEPAALAAWQSEFGDPAGPAAAQRPGDNPTAVRLRALGSGAGVDLNREAEHGPPARAIAEYVSAEERKPGGPVSPPPDAVRAYLDAHRAGLDAVVDLLTHAETPSWKTSDGWGRPADVSLLGLKQLSGILTADALALSSAGRAVDAERALLASWQLGASTDEYPDVIDQLIAEQTATVPAVLARRLAIDVASWRVRLAERDEPAGMMRALVMHGSQMWSAGNSQMARAARADYLDLQRAYFVTMRDLPLTTPLAESYSEAAARRDGWSAGAIVAVMGHSGDVRAWRDAEYAGLELELSDRVLRARQLKAQLGRWPATIPDVETSRIAGIRWTYRVDAAGRMSIAVSPLLQGAEPPLRFESSD